MELRLDRLTKEYGSKIAVDDFSVTLEEYRNILGYLPQDFGYYPNFSAEKFLLYMSSLKGLDKRFARERSEELLELVGLSQVKKKK